jgi:hypothetical protein
MSTTILTHDLQNGYNFLPENDTPSDRKFYLTEDVITRFHYPLNDIPDDGNGNFRPYDIYATKINLEKVVHQKYPYLRVELNPKEFKGEMYMVVQLFDGNTEFPIEADFKKELDDFLQQLNFYFLPLISSFRDIEYDDVILPSWWLATILGHLEIFHHTYEFRDGSIYVDLGVFQDFSGVYHRLIMECLRLLVQMYRHGVYSLDDQSEASLIRNWELKEYELIDFTEVRLLSDYGGLKLFRPSRYSLLYAPDPVEFMRQRQQGWHRIQLKIGSELAARYHITQILHRKGYVPEFYDETVLVEAMTLNQALRITHYVSKALATRSMTEHMFKMRFDVKPRGDVIPGSSNSRNIGHDESNLVEYYDIVSGPVRIETVMVIPSF